MPKHQGPIQRLMDPFSIPAQMNNLGVLIVAHVAQSMSSQSKCIDDGNKDFLEFIYYGSTIVCTGTFLLSIFYMIGLIDYCINKIVPCGQVCLTLNSLTVFLAGILYHFIATLYGLYEMIFGQQSACVEIEMFKRITCMIYTIWFFCIVTYLILNGCYLKRVKKLQSVQENFVELT